MAAPWQAPLGLARSALSTATAVPRRALGLVGDLVGLVEDLSSSAERISRLLDVVEAVPPRVVAVLDEVEAVLASVTPIPDRVDALIVEIGAVPPKVDALVAQIGEVPPKVDALIAQIGQVPPNVDALLGTVAETAEAVRPVLTAATRHTKAAGTAIAQVQGLLAEAEPLLSAVAKLDPAVLAAVVTVLDHAETVLAQTVELDAVASLEGLVPVVAKLSTVVDNLNEQVVEVGALLGGIPGAARLLKRGDARKAIEHR